MPTPRTKTAAASATPLMTIENLRKTYQAPDHSDRLVLDGIDFTLNEGEIVAVLGKSGSGKSTFLRIFAGLVPATSGTVSYRGRSIDGPVQGVGMVFQSFALFPWLTVQGNVELGLQAMGVPKKERAEKAEAAIDLIGLAGFESAYPKELSGGMRQRVGFARALVINPDILLLDEPFSALDVLTAETLRGDLMDLWSERKIPTNGILFVSHNIEEAVEVADRIVVFGSDPGRIRAEIKVPLPRPRDWASDEFRAIVDEVYILLTTHPAKGSKRGKAESIGIGYRLPDAPVQQITGLIEALADTPYNGKADLPELADDQNLSMDELFPLIETFQLLGLAIVEGGDIELTKVGRTYAEADLGERKEMFAKGVREQIPLAAHILKVLEERPNHRAPASRFQRELEDFISEEEAERVLETIINWGRHAELFAYDYDSEVFSLDEE